MRVPGSRGDRGGPGLVGSSSLWAVTDAPSDTVPTAAAGPAGVIERWRSEVTTDGAPDTMLWRSAAAALELTNAHPAGLAKLHSGRATRLSELFREPASRARALRAAGAVRAKEIELDRQHGLPGCYLLAGTATWAAGDTRVPAAPVFLRRCRVRPIGAVGADYVVEVDGAMTFNPALHDRLAADFGITLDAPELTRISLLGNGFDPTGAFAAVDDAARGVPGWSLQRGLRITTVHVAHAAAVADFERAAPRLSAHPVVGRLIAAEQAGHDPAPGEPGLPDNPDEPFVLDADPAQVAALERARDGVSLVIDAAPGTGKSQTIVNLAADLARVGARTLVVIPSRVGRAAVAGRLDHLGLGHLLHEPRVDQAPWLSVRATRPVPPVRDPDRRDHGDDDPQDAWPAWSSAREALHAHVVRMHGRRRPWGVSLDEIQARLVALGHSKHPPRSKVRITGAALAGLDPAARDHWRAELVRIAEQSAWSSGLDDDPWWGADIPDAAARQEMHAALAGCSAAAFAGLDATFADVFAGIALPDLPTLGHYRDFVAEMAGIGEVLAVFRLGIFDAPLEQWVAAGTGTRERWRTHRAVKALLRPGATLEQGLAVLDRAREVRPLWLRVRASDVLPSQVGGLDRAEHAYAALAAPVTVLQARLARDPDRPPLLDLPVPQLRALIERLEATRDRLDVLPQTRPALVAAREAGLEDLVHDLARRAVPADRVGAEVDLVWWSSVLQTVTAADPGYAAARGDELRSTAGAFRAADLALQRQLAADLAQRPTPDGPPVWLVSARSAAELLPEDATFDVVVVDEAHAVTPAIVAAVLSRAPQAVIVGDSRMPGPRGFTACAGARVVEGETEPASLLDVASRTLPVLRLPWHYRSHDHRLVAALRGPYAGSFAAFPAPSGAAAVSLERVAPPEPPEPPTAADSAVLPGSENPADPAEHRRLLADAAAARALACAEERPTESVAIIAVTPRLARLTATAVRARSSRVPDQVVADDGPEPLLVFDAASGAAEVRDTIVLVLDGDALTADPRLLTAATSRARARLVVVHPFAAGESTGSPLIDDLFADGASPDVPGAAAGSVLVDDLARRLTARGLAVATSYGAAGAGGTVRGGSTVDGERAGVPAGADATDAGSAPDDWSAPDGAVELAVRDPFAKSAPMVAVELDGLRYARAGGIRMRERIRVAQLHRLGWRVIHVASVDLFRDPAREVARIAAAIEGLHADPPGQRHDGDVPATDGSPNGPVASRATQAEASSPGAPRPRRATSGPVTIGGDGPAPSRAPGDTAAAGPPAPPEPDRSVAGRSGTAGSVTGRPEQSRDDTPEGWGEAPEDDSRERWFRENRPPHWDR